MNIGFSENLPIYELTSSVKLVAFVGFLAAATLFIGFNHQIFQLVLGEKSKTYWWLFAVLVTIPFFLILYAFTFFFGEFIQT